MSHEFGWHGQALSLASVVLGIVLEFAMTCRRLILCLLLAFTARAAEPVPAGVQASDTGIKHSLLVCGATTAIIGEDGSVSASFPYNTRDGYVLPSSGNLLLAVSKSKD